VTTADLLKAARDVLPPASGARPIATVEQTRGHALPDGSPAGVGGQTVYRAAWLVDGRRRAFPFGPAFDRPRDLGRFLDLLTGGGA
jgi:hypothetical protein